MGTVAYNIVKAYGVRVDVVEEWVALDALPAGDISLQESSPKFTKATFCPVTLPESTVDKYITIHICLMHRGNYEDLKEIEVNGAESALFLNFDLRIDYGATFILEDFYIDQFRSAVLAEEPVSQEAASPIVCVWLKGGTVEGEPCVDVILRR